MQRLTKDQAFQKIKYYCAYQERCHAEVKEKLYSYGLHRGDVDWLISQLIEENYLNEERFAIQFAGGKFRLKQWGKTKIIYALKQKRVSEWCINRALKDIDSESYENTVRKLAGEKWQSLRGEKNLFTKMAKTQAFLQQRGFETALIAAMISELREDK